MLSIGLRLWAIALRARAAGAPAETFRWTLEDDTGDWALEDDSGFWLTEDAA